MGGQFGPDLGGQFHRIFQLRPNLQKYFYHTSINFPPDENLSNEKMKSIGNDYLQQNGFNQHQFIMFRHHDADHPHLHILVNRIGYDGKVLSDSNDYARSEKVLRELEMKYNLTQVVSSKQASKRAPTKDELEMMKRTNKPSSKLKLQSLIQKIMEDNPRLTTQDFIKALHSNKINVLFNQASTGYVSGISYSYEGMIMTGSKLGKDFKWTTIKNKIDYDQERDMTTIHQSNSKVKFIRLKLHHDNNNYTVIPKTSKKFLSKSSLIDIRFFNDLDSTDQQPEIDSERFLRLRKRKKRKKRLRH